MRILVLSDLHNEFEPFVPSGVDADVVVLAGDIDLGTRGVAWAASAFAGKPVIYVAGNHEYYGRALPKLTDELRTRGSVSSVHFLEQGAVRVGGIRFLGCTLWTDFEVTGSRARSMVVCAEVMNDFRKIRVSPSFRRLRPSDQAALHRATLAWLTAAIAEDPEHTVVVSHHAPSARSLNPVYEGDPISAAYVSALDAFVADSGVPLWIHGHTHYCVDYRIGRTRIVSNQRGYPGEQLDVRFDPRFVVEVGC